MNQEPKAEKTRSTQEQIAYEIREIMDLKAQGWSDRQIRNELKLSHRKYDQRKEKLRDSEVFKMEALEFLNETVHRLRYLRMKAFNDYSAWKEAKQYNAAVGAFRRMVEIDTALPKMCLDLGWSIDDLNQFYRKKEVHKKTQVPESEDELRRQYKELVKSEC